MANRDNKVKFLSVAAFKKAIGATNLEVVFNEKSGKLSVLADESSFFRCQQDIDSAGNMAFLVPDGELDNACLVNTSSAGSPLTSKFSL
jgi:hypothetical protein